jgi:acyl-CoA thioester hydrolase
MFEIDPNKHYPVQTESHSVIRFQDCDPLRHLNNAKYFDYYFNAREDQVAMQYDFRSDYPFRRYQASWVVYQHQIAYVRPANVGEWITILSSIIFFDDNTIVTEYLMTNQDKTELKNVLWTTSKYISVATGKVITHHPELDKFLHVICPEPIDFAHTSFNGRIRQLKENLAAGQF